MKKISLLFISSFALFTIAVNNGSANAWSLFPDKVCNTAETKNSPTCQQAKQQTKTDNPAAKIIGDAANIIALAAGVAAVLMIIVGGFQLVTSGGSAETVSKARGRIIGALIGLIIIALAWTIIRLVTDKILP